ncbi:MAG: TetR/AcrR family transcriptional regulator [Bacteroidota bacterium]
MKKTKEKILSTAHRLFNEQGVANVSLRKIAEEMGISHSNLIYHFKSKNEIIEQLHLQILAAAQAGNQQFREQKSSLLKLRNTIGSGFQVLYEYRFFMLDLNYILRENEQLHAFFLEVEALRAKIYQDAIEEFISNGLMRAAIYPKEYEQLIERIRIFSDFWIASSEIYNTEQPTVIIEKHVQLFMSLFFPYLTEEGRAQYLALR